MAQFELPEKYKEKYNALEMTNEDWRALQKDVNIHCFRWAKVQYIKRQNPDADVKCTEGLSAVCSRCFIGYCTVPELYCSHQYVETSDMVEGAEYGAV